MSNGRRQAGGFAYLLLLAIVAILSIATVASVSVGVAITRRDAEERLLTIGAEFERALASYRTASLTEVGVGVGGTNPTSLEQLLKDPRYPGIKRHIRQIYGDPMTGDSVWGLVKAPDGSIMGVYSLGSGVPIKQTGFAVPWWDFERAHSYAEWVFGLPVQERATRESTLSTHAPQR